MTTSSGNDTSALPDGYIPGEMTQIHLSGGDRSADYDQWQAVAVAPNGKPLFGLGDTQDLAREALAMQCREHHRQATLATADPLTRLLETVRVAQSREYLQFYCDEVAVCLIAIAQILARKA